MDTKVMAPAITPRRTEPAITELSKFFKDGVTAASTAKGWESVAIIAAVIAAGTATVALLTS